MVTVAAAWMMTTVGAVSATMTIAAEGGEA
jgi:hypothetical protein